ncbi:MAG: nucleotidyltransferase family protein [Dehalococcoidia bacterium]|nr:nucleotidyltransferase family protein [Dehalococcoidia bacterium]
MTGIDRAIVLAAGKGTRLGSLTAEAPKPLLEVGGRPILVRIIDGLMRAGIERFLVVTGHLGELIEAELGNGAAAGIQIAYARQERLEGTARALALGREFAGDERFFFGWGDILVRPENYRLAIRRARLADAVIAVNEVDDPWAGGAVYVDDAMRVTRLVEKPAKGRSTTRWNNAGFGVLGPEIWPLIAALDPSERGEYELPQAVGALIASGARVVASPVEGPWFDIGTPEQLTAARQAF